MSQLCLCHSLQINSLNSIHKADTGWCLKGMKKSRYAEKLLMIWCEMYFQWSNFLANNVINTVLSTVCTVYTIDWTPCHVNAMSLWPINKSIVLLMIVFLMSLMITNIKFRYSLFLPQNLIILKKKEHSIHRYVRCIQQCILHIYVCMYTLYLYTYKYINE